MKCPNCPVEMVVDHTGKKVEGDNSPDTPTRVYEQQYFTCPNPKCPKYGQIVDGEPILIYDGGAQAAEARQLTLPDEIVECCGNTLCSYNTSSYTIANEAYPTAKLKDGILSLECPACHDVKVLNVGGRVNINR